MARSAADAVSVQIAEGVNAPWTTSAGRFLDAVAAWIGVCRERTYEGEPAMRLEAAARGGTAYNVVPHVVETEGWIDIDLVPGFRTLTEMAQRGVAVADIAATTQALLAWGAAEAAIRAASARRMDSICLSGGVAVNDAIAARFRERVKAAGLKTVTNEWVPCGDGGVSFGQAVFAGRKWRLDP
jgi:hydrogenase maturation protein HypF